MGPLWDPYGTPMGPWYPIDGSAWPGLAWLGFGRLAWFALARPRLSQLASPQLGLSQEQQHWRGEAPPQPAEGGLLLLLL